MKPTVVAHRSQRYSAIKKELLRRGEIFVDNEFPANSKSLFFSRVCNDVEWKRPKDLCKVPRLCLDGSTCSDLNEGELGNRWFVAACCNLAREPRLWQKVIANHREQEWEHDAPHAGIFHFLFWRYGHWVDVVISDELPTRDGRLLFCHSHTTNEFWPALLEKAYAKLYGDYESLKSCCAVDMLVDLTGGVAQKYIISELDIKWDINRVRLFQELHEALDSKALLTCSIDCDTESSGDAMEEGLIRGNGYAVTAIRVIQVPKDLREMVGTPELFIVRLRNTLEKKQWNGSWSDTSKQWNHLSTKDREKFGLTFEQENDFWMSFDDFVKYFTNVDICHFFNTTFFTVSKTWCEAMLSGEWTAGAKGTVKDRAGGGNKNNSFLQNHQYMFDMASEQDTIILSVEQDDIDLTKTSGVNHRQIGVQIIKVESNRKYRVHVAGEKVLAPQYLCSRNIFKKVVLKRGRYVVIPSTLDPGVEGKFILRIYTSCIACARKAAQKVEPLATGFGFVRPLTKESPSQTSCLFVKRISVVSQITIIDADGLEQGKGIDTYVVVICEGETAKSHWLKNVSDPKWNFKAIFYRKQPALKPVTVEIWSRRMLVDTLLATTSITDLDTTGRPVVKLCSLYKKMKTQKYMQLPGSLRVQITSSDDLCAL